MNKLLRHRPSPAMVVACIALAIALGGTSYAAIRLPANSVGTKQLKKNAVKRSKIAAKAVNGSKVAADSLTGANILESSLGTVPSATNAAHASTADTAAPTGSAGGDLSGSYPSPTIAAGAVTGTKVANNTLGAAQIDEASLDYGSAGCKFGGLIHSFARIKGDSSMPSTYTTSSTYRDIVHNCGGGTTEVRRGVAGQYFLRFNSDPAALALAVSNYDDSCNSAGFNNSVSVSKSTAGGDAGAFEVRTRSVDDALLEDACVTVMTF